MGQCGEYRLRGKESHHSILTQQDPNLLPVDRNRAYSWEEEQEQGDGQDVTMPSENLQHRNKITVPQETCNMKQDMKKANTQTICHLLRKLCNYFSSHL